MRRAALLSAGALCLVATMFPLVHAGAADANGSGFGSYAMFAAAPGVELKVGEPTYCFVTPAGLNGCEGVIPEASSQLQNGPIGSATAAIAWPGSLAANLGSLIITAGGSNVPPQATMLNDPVRAEARTGSAPDTVTNTSVPNVTMKAVAKPLGTSALATISDLSIGAVGTFGSIKGETSTVVTGVKQITSKASSQVANVVIAGVVKIGGITSTAEATSDGATAKVKGGTTVTNATIAGFPVTIDENGVGVQGQGVALTTATAAVNAALKQAGLTLLVSEPQGKPDGSRVTYTAGSLVAQFTQMGYSLGLTLGGANVVANAAAGFDSPSTTTGGFVPGTTGGSSTGGSTGVAGTTGGGLIPDGSTGGVSGVPPVTDPGTGQPPTTLDPVLSASPSRLAKHPLGPGAVLLGLLGAGLLLAGMRRLPDRILEAHAPVCPLEESA